MESKDKTEKLKSLFDQNPKTRNSELVNFGIGICIRHIESIII